jgi:hypothetical protein
MKFSATGTQGVGHGVTKRKQNISLGSSGASLSDTLCI